MNAPDKAQEIKGVITGVFVMLTAFWGWLGWSILLMLVCMFTDYLTGSLAARRSGTWSSAVAGSQPVSSWFLISDFEVIMNRAAGIPLPDTSAMTSAR